MSRHWLIVLLALSLIGSSAFGFTKGAKSGAADAEAAETAKEVSVPASPVPEAKDFATENFGDGWDMAEFTDVSQYLNGAGRHPFLANIQVKDGLFSATSLGDRTANIAFFFPLYPGYKNFMQIGGNLGSQHGIDPGAYQCVYIATRVNSQYRAGSELADGFRVLWNNESVNGGTNQVYFYPETIFGTAPIVHNWRLYQVDLRNPPNSSFGASWTSHTWQGLQINPTLYKNIPFAIDWIRLGSCDNNPAYKAQITWNADGNINAIWANPVGTDRNILVAAKDLTGIQGGVDGSKGSYALDTKGLAPGSYRIGLGTTTNCCSQWSDGQLKINQAPVIKFARPSPYSGEDYAFSGGNPWDMDPSDFTRIDCTQASFGDGLLRMDTGYPASLPRECKGPAIGEADPQLFLNLPAPLITAGQYRYLSFRMYMNGDYQMPADGMIGRLMWTNTNNCTRVSADIPYDIGWHTYTIDLYDALNGTPVASAPGDCGLKPWKEAGQVVQLRFDPNENWTGNMVPQMVFHQELDWIRLTKVDRVAKGASFPIQIIPNKPLSEIRSIQYFYTTDPGNPTQNPAGSSAIESERVSGSAMAATNPVYLPIVGRNASPGLPGSYTYSLSTSDIQPGEYYICAQADDGYNQTTYCSDAPLQVYSP